MGPALGLAGCHLGFKLLEGMPMRLDRFDLNLLVVLDALLAERNVTRASQRLHIGQSAASAALARLREHFGDPLLVPVGRRFMLTPLATSLVDPVRDTCYRPGPRSRASPASIPPRSSAALWSAPRITSPP